MNFISTFEELNKLYEDMETQEKIAFMDFTGSSFAFEDIYKKQIEKDGFEGKVNTVEDTAMKAVVDAVESGADVTLYTCDDDYKQIKSLAGKNNFKVVTVAPTPVEEACSQDKLTEAEEDDEEIEIVDDEPTDVVPVEEPVVDDEPKQVVIECSKCGALLIKDEVDIVAGEEADLVNVEDECQFCEEANGYKIVGTLLPYEAVEDEEPIDEVVEESVEVPAEEETLEEILDINIPVDVQANDNEVAVGGATV